jgi:dihydroorotate dehydrogenase
VTSFERLFPFADYVTVNVSSPNTQGLRDLQQVESLRELLGTLLERGRALAVDTGTNPLPIFVKIAPDMTAEQAAEIVELAAELGLHGIVATNTTIARDGLTTPADRVAAIGAGGLSGAPLTERSRAFVSHLYTCAAGRLPIIGVGGIMNGDDAYEMIRAGASVVQVYTGFIYAGPTFIRDIHRRLAERLDADGYASIEEAVGAAHREG